MKHILNFTIFETIQTDNEQITSKKFDLNLSAMFTQSKYELNNNDIIALNEKLNSVLQYVNNNPNYLKIKVKIVASESPSTPPKRMEYGDLSKLRSKTAIQHISNFFNDNLKDPKIEILKSNIRVPSRAEIEKYKSTIRPKLRSIMNKVNSNDKQALKQAKLQVANILNDVYKNERYFKVKIYIITPSNPNQKSNPKPVHKRKQFHFKTKPSKTKRNVCIRNGKKYSCKNLKNRQNKKRR
jgi:aspartyl/asparaginyl-tRNA synthetase